MKDEILIHCDGPFGDLLGLEINGKKYTTKQILEVLETVKRLERAKDEAISEDHRIMFEEILEGKE